jgi:hypothetical protein
MAEVKPASSVKALLNLGKWIVHDGLWVTDDGELILDPEGAPTRQISDGQQVIFAVHLRDACIALEKERSERFPDRR